MKNEDTYFVLLLTLIFILYNALGWIADNIPFNLASDILLLGSLIFIILDLFMILIKKEFFFLTLLGKSVFSKPAVFAVVIGYVISILFVYATTLKTIENKDNYRFLNEFGATTMEYKFVNILLLRTSPIAVFSEKLTDQQAKKLIESNYPKEFALQFRMDDPKSKKTLNYTVYFEESKHYVINSIYAYLFLYILVWSYTKMHSESNTMWRKISRIVVMGLAILILFGLGFPKYSYFHWRSSSPLRDLLTKEMHFLQSEDKQNYTLLLKGK